MKPQHYQKRIKVHFGRVWHFCITNSPPRIYKTFYCFGQCGRAWREKNILILEVKRPVIKVSILLCWTHRRRVIKNLWDLGVTTFCRSCPKSRFLENVYTSNFFSFKKANSMLFSPHQHQKKLNWQKHFRNVSVFDTNFLYVDNYFSTKKNSCKGCSLPWSPPPTSMLALQLPLLFQSW